MYRRIDGRARELLERIELLPASRVHRAAARDGCEGADACAERELRWGERLRGMLAGLRGARARERRK